MEKFQRVVSYLIDISSLYVVHSQIFLMIYFTGTWNNYTITELQYIQPEITQTTEKHDDRSYCPPCGFAV